MSQNELTERDFAIIKFRQEGLFTREIAGRLTLSIGHTGTLINQLIRSGHITKRARGGPWRKGKHGGKMKTSHLFPVLEEATISLYSQGIGLAQIGEITGFSGVQISNLTVRLRREGKITQYHQVRSGHQREIISRFYERSLIVKEEWRDLRNKIEGTDDMIITMRAEGLNNPEIARELGIRRSQVEGRVHRLINEGRLTKSKSMGRPFGIRNECKRFQVTTSLENALNRSIIMMTRYGLTLVEMGLILRCSHEWVRQKRNLLIQRYGEEMFRHPHVSGAATQTRL